MTNSSIRMSSKVKALFDQGSEDLFESFFKGNSYTCDESKSFANQRICSHENDEKDKGPYEVVIKSPFKNLVNIPDDSVLETFIKEYENECNFDCDDELILNTLKAKYFSPVKNPLKRHPNQGMCLLQEDQKDETYSQSQSENLIYIDDDIVIEEYILNYNTRNVKSIVKYTNTKNIVRQF